MCASVTSTDEGRKARLKWLHGLSVAAFPDACIVASVHWPSLLARFDTVVVVEAGRVVDVSSRDAVLARRA